MRKTLPISREKMHNKFCFRCLPFFSAKKFAGKLYYFFFSGWLSIFLSHWYFSQSCCYQEPKGNHQEAYKNQYWQKICLITAGQQCLTLFLFLFFFNYSVSTPLHPHTPANSFQWCTEDDAFCYIKVHPILCPFSGCCTCNWNAVTTINKTRKASLWDLNPRLNSCFGEKKIPQTQEDPKQWQGSRKSYIFTSLRQLPLQGGDFVTHPLSHHPSPSYQNKLSRAKFEIPGIIHTPFIIYSHV